MGDGIDRNLAESERAVLLFFLNRVRDAVVRASAGLTGEIWKSVAVPDAKCEIMGDTTDAVCPETRALGCGLTLN
jgi:hypothetical protein